MFQKERKKEKRKHLFYVKLHMCDVVCLCIIRTYDLDMRAGSDACGNVGGDTLPLSMVLLRE